MLIGIGERLSRPYKSLEGTRDFTRYHKAEKLVRMLVFTLLCLVLFSIIPAVIIMRFEDWNFVESWYFTIVTLTTVGFGDKVPGKDIIITKTCPCNVYLLIPHFYIVKIGYAGVYLFFLARRF